MFLRASSISLICPGRSDSGTPFSRTSRTEQRSLFRLSLSPWRPTKSQRVKRCMVTFDLQVRPFLFHSQELAVGLHPGVEPPLPFLAGDFTVKPRHLLVGGGGDELLQLGGLTHDGLLHRIALCASHTERELFNFAGFVSFQMSVCADWEHTEHQHMICTLYHSRLIYFFNMALSSPLMVGALTEPPGALSPPGSRSAVRSPSACRLSCCQRC